MQVLCKEIMCSFALGIEFVIMLQFKAYMMIPITSLSIVQIAFGAKFNYLKRPYKKLNLY